MTRNRSRRRGLAIVPAMVCLMLVGLLCASVLKLAHTQRGAVAAEERRMQAEWLAEAGLARAAARLAATGGDAGETWDVSAAELGGADPARVRITVGPVEGAPGRRRVRVQADYPREGTRRVRVSKTTLLDVGTDSRKEPS